MKRSILQYFIAISLAKLINGVKFAGTCSRNASNNTYRQHECAKRRAYEERVREIEHAHFSPLVFSISGGMGPSTTVTYKRLAFLLSVKWKTPYCRVMSWLRCRLGFSLSSCALGVPVPAPLRGHVSASIDLALEEGRFGAV